MFARFTASFIWLQRTDFLLERRWRGLLRLDGFPSLQLLNSLCRMETVEGIGGIQSVVMLKDFNTYQGNTTETSESTAPWRAPPWCDLPPG